MPVLSQLLKRIHCINGKNSDVYVDLTIQDTEMSGYIWYIFWRTILYK